MCLQAALPTVKHKRAWLCPPMLSATAHGRQTRRTLWPALPPRTHRLCVLFYLFQQLYAACLVLPYLNCPSFLHVSTVSFRASIKALFIRRAAFVFFISRTFPEKVDSFFLRRKQKRNPVSYLHRTFQVSFYYTYYLYFLLGSTVTLCFRLSVVF